MTTDNDDAAMSDDQGHSMTEDTGDDSRDPHGRFTRQVDTVKRDAEALKLKARGRNYTEIAEALGYSDKSAAYKAVKRGLADTVGEAAEEVRAVEVARLDSMYAKVMAVLERDHVTVSQGRIVRARVLDDNGDPIVVAQTKDGKPIFREEEVLDDGPVLAAVGRLLDIQKRRAALLGLDAPTRAEVGGTLSYEIVGVQLDQL